MTRRSRFSSIQFVTPTICGVFLLLLGAGPGDCYSNQPSGQYSGEYSGGTYRDKHGNEGTITLGSAEVNIAGAGIDYSVPYTLTDSEGNKSGEYRITSEMLPGRDPGSDDFVLNVFVIDDASQNAAELIFRNNPNVAPLMPILRLLDCSTDPCTEVKRNDEPMWGAWVIQEQSDIANYPIELLDTRVTTHLLEPDQLSQLPNSTDGNGNWAEIMENHRNNFSEARFRIDVDHLGEAQSDLLTSRMIAEIDANRGAVCTADGDCAAGEVCRSSGLSMRCNSPDDWLVLHYDPACGFGAQDDPPCDGPTGIQHSSLTFLTEHRKLIEDMTTTLFNKHLDDWPLNFTFPFGRMPVWLVDPHLDADPVDFHVLPTHWEQVVAGQVGLDNAGCWHDYPEDGDTPTLTNGPTNIGQYVCEQAPATPTGFVNRPCTLEADYSGPGVNGTSIRSDLEVAFHNPIHGFILGSFGPPETTAGTMVFWVFHTYVSTVVLSNWRQAQMREMPESFANRPPVCDANGPYLAECQGATTDVTLDGSASFDPDGDPLSFDWSGGFEGGTAIGVNPTVAFPGTGSFDVDLEVSDGMLTATCNAPVTVVDTTAPDVTAALIRLNGDDDDDGRFRVEFDCTDVCDASPSITSATLNGIPVSIGQVVELEKDDDREVGFDDGILQIEARSFELLVSCEDAMTTTTMTTTMTTTTTDPVAHSRRPREGAEELV
jgi:hypothetical protein